MVKVARDRSRSRGERRRVGNRSLPRSRRGGVTSMIRRTHLAAIAIVVLVVALTIPAAGLSLTGSQKKGVTVTIWDFFVNSPKERAALMQVAHQWAKQTGNTVVNPGD